MELLVVMVTLALSYTIRSCIGTGVCSSTYDIGLNKYGAFQFPVFHRKHPCLDSPSIHLAAANLAEANPVIGNDAIHKGKFLMAISLGTPSVFNLVTIDTGSTLSWVQCQNCQLRCHTHAAEAGSILDPRNSTTYKHIGCSSKACVDVHESLDVPFGCVEETDTCLYSLRYGSGPLAQYSAGRLGTDKHKFTLPVPDGYSIVDDFIFGCSEDDRFNGREAGVGGSGNESFSFFNQVARHTNYSAFSYCFPGNHGAQGFLSIGPYAKDKLLLTHLIGGYGDRLVYSLQQLDMMAEGERLQVDPSVYARRMMISDSGTADTFLLAPVFYALDKAMTAAMRSKGYDRQLVGETTTCFRFTGDSVDWSDLPTVEMRFTRTTLKLPPGNVFHQRSIGLICLAFQPDAAGVRGVQILGNKATRSFRVVYDLQAMKFGFQPDAC